MKAFFIEAPGRFAFRDVARPQFGPQDILIQVNQVGFCGSDLKTFRGGNPLVQYPRIPGHEIAGTIAEIGSDVPDDYPVGQTATVLPYTACGLCAACRRQRHHACERNQTLGVQRDGAFTKFISVPYAKVLPVKLGPAERALIEPLSVGFHAAARGEVSPGETVMVLGCGMIGLGAIAGARQRGATVIATDLEERKLRVARLAGAHHTLRSDRGEFAARLRSYAPEGPDVVIEAVGLASTYRSAVQHVAYAGRVVFIGYTSGAVEFEAPLVVKKELDLRGSRNATGGDFHEVIRLLQSGMFPVVDTVTHFGRWEQAGDLLASWSEQPGLVTKIQIEI
ncbi:MAG TPA: zinc-binding alcohol dehydrogenase family protein [Opitutaceae bacterium]